MNKKVRLRNFFQVAKGGRFAVETYQMILLKKKVFFLPELSFFAEIWKILVLEILSKFSENSISSRRCFQPSKKESLAKLEGRIYAGGGRPSCSKYFTNFKLLI